MLLILVTVLGIVPGVVKADFTFGEPTNLGQVVNSSSSSDYFACPSADGLELFFVSNRPGGSGAEDLWVTTRSSAGESWGEPVNLGSVVNTPYTDSAPCLSADGLELYFSGNYPDGSYIRRTTRPTKHDAWGEPENLGAALYIDSETLVLCPSLSGDGLELYVSVGHAEPVHEWSIAVARRAGKDAPWEAPIRLGPEINSWSCQGHQGISSDGLLLVFSDIWTCSPRPGGLGDTDIWFTRRAARDGDWCAPMNLGAPVNTRLSEDHPRISADGSMLYFTSYRFDAAMEELCQAPIIPIVDLNNDGIVDSADMVIMVDNWGTANSLCDIGPMPWGDGVVDVQDLIVLAEHLFEEVPRRPGRR